MFGLWAFLHKKEITQPNRMCIYFDTNAGRIIIRFLLDCLKQLLVNNELSYTLCYNSNFQYSWVALPLVIFWINSWNFWVVALAWVNRIWVSFSSRIGIWVLYLLSNRFRRLLYFYFFSLGLVVLLVDSRYETC